MSAFRERIDQLSHKYNISLREIEVLCGISRGVLAKAGDRTGIDLAAKILSAFQSVSAAWLITGQGAMTYTAEQIELQKKGALIDENNKLRSALNDFNEKLDIIKNQIEEMKTITDPKNYAIHESKSLMAADQEEIYQTVIKNEEQSDAKK